MLPEAFGCAVANRFGNLLDDDADPLDLLSEAEKVKERKKKKKEEEDKRAKLKKAGQKESQKDRRLPRSALGPDPVPALKQQQQTRPVPVASGRNGPEVVQKGAKRSTFVERKAKQEEPLQEFSIPKASYNADSNLRGRGGAGGRRGGNARSSDNFNIRGKREYDRHNGTGISPDEKRGGRGPWNWGCVDEAASELMEVTSDVLVKSEEPQVPVEDGTQNQSVEEDGEMVVQVAMEMSLDEWKALQEMSRPKAEFNIRKAENKIPSKAKVIHQSRQPEKFVEALDDMEDDGSFFRKSVNDITSMLEINFGSLDRPRRGGRGRGDPVGAGSRPERTKPVQPKQEEPLAPNPDNPEEFPALPTGK
ncbi:intracellular hyaluronan-binding protein 4-like isoform X1 [Takifugu flavidus]|uniref:Intracellular hyaluronan-binding protein 4 n=1 Tax=Takifugu flavidus TaxID=433684 RepID=A0A5C6MZL3_9TELE|nr:intracellular hyaluronan-binding protein 4-like isoform X1 [Takifugu flavidus]TWW60602.1 Intracellular hyaluronan-binding protein 4 [Takifugu flavidus]